MIVFDVQLTRSWSDARDIRAGKTIRSGVALEGLALLQPFCRHKNKTTEVGRQSPRQQNGQHWLQHLISSHGSWRSAGRSLRRAVRASVATQSAFYVRQNNPRFAFTNSSFLTDHFFIWKVKITDVVMLNPLWAGLPITCNLMSMYWHAFHCIA